MKTTAPSLFAFKKTPTRSILKSDGCYSEKKKTVLFQNAEGDLNIENDAIPGTSTKLIIMIATIYANLSSFCVF